MAGVEDAPVAQVLGVGRRLGLSLRPLLPCEKHIPRVRRRAVGHMGGGHLETSMGTQERESGLVERQEGSQGGSRKGNGGQPGSSEGYQQ